MHFQYDANGNLLNDGKRSYQWDGADRLIQITDLQTGVSSEFAYDGFSRRTTETEKTPAAKSLKKLKISGVVKRSAHSKTQQAKPLTASLPKAKCKMEKFIYMPKTKSAASMRSSTAKERWQAAPPTTLTVISLIKQAHSPSWLTQVYISIKKAAYTSPPTAPTTAPLHAGSIATR